MLKRLKDKKVEEILFLSLCSAKDRDKLLKRTKMNLEDFLRITYILDRMGLFLYELCVFENFPQLREKGEILLGSQTSMPKDSYYDDEEIYEKYNDWLVEFRISVKDKLKIRRNRTVLSGDKIRR